MQDLLQRCSMAVIGTKNSILQIHTFKINSLYNFIRELPVYTKTAFYCYKNIILSY